MYCGVDVVVREAIRAVAGPSAETLVDLGRKAMDGANATDAFQLFSRALEADPKNVAALMGKGEAAGWCSTIANMRFSEMSTYFNDAIKLAAPEAREDTKKLAALHIMGVSGALWGQSVDRFIKFVAVDDVWTEFIGQSRTIVQANELALVYDPSNKVLLKNIVTVCEQLLEGFRYTTHGGSPAVRNVGPEAERQFREWREKAAFRLRKLDPTFTLPEVKRAKLSGCCVFIALVAFVPIFIWLIRSNS